MVCAANVCCEAKQLHRQIAEANSVSPGGTFCCCWAPQNQQESSGGSKWAVREKGGEQSEGRRRLQVTSLLCNSEYRSEHKKEELPGVFTLHLLLTTRLALHGCWLPSVSTATFKNGQLSSRKFLTRWANGETLPFSLHHFPAKRNGISGILPGSGDPCEDVDWERRKRNAWTKLRMGPKIRKRGMDAS